MRRETGYLLDDGEPVGGEWNYADQNRETPPDGWEPADSPTFETDETTRETAERAEATFAGGYDEPPTAVTGPTPARSTDPPLVIACSLYVANFRWGVQQYR